MISKAKFIASIVRWTLIVFVIGLALTPTPAQEATTHLRHGTILLYEETPKQVMIVADSKVHGAGRDGITCKIINLSDDTLFFYTGQLFEVFDKGKKVLSQQTIAQGAYNDFKYEARSYQRLIDVATRYTERVRPKMDELIRSGIKYDISGLAGFASLDESNHPKIVRANIVINPPGNEAPAQTTSEGLSEPQQNLLNLGNYPQYAGVNEFFDAKTPRAKRAMDRFNTHAKSLPERDVEVSKLIAATEAALIWHRDDPTIGPPVDAVVIESGTGIRWIRRKKMCALKNRRESHPRAQRPVAGRHQIMFRAFPASARSGDRTCQVMVRTCPVSRLIGTLARFSWK